MWVHWNGLYLNMIKTYFVSSGGWNKRYKNGLDICWSDWGSLISDSIRVIAAESKVARNLGKIGNGHGSCELADDVSQENDKVTIRMSPPHHSLLKMNVNFDLPSNCLLFQSWHGEFHKPAIFKKSIFLCKLTLFPACKRSQAEPVHKPVQRTSVLPSLCLSINLIKSAWKSLCGFLSTSILWNLRTTMLVTIGMEVCWGFNKLGNLKTILQERAERERKISVKANKLNYCL